MTKLDMVSVIDAGIGLHTSYTPSHLSDRAYGMMPLIVFLIRVTLPEFWYYA